MRTTCDRHKQSRTFFPCTRYGTSVYLLPGTGESEGIDMDSSTIQDWQIAKLQKSLQPMLGYLYRLLDRMQRVGFLPDDRLYQRVSKAYDAMHSLFIELHYLACDGTGRPPRGNP